MMEYLLSTEDGRIKKEGKKQTGSNRIVLLSTEQLHALDNCPHHQMLERSMRTVHYCKVELFAESIQGTIPAGNWRLDFRFSRISCCWLEMSIGFRRWWSGWERVCAAVSVCGIFCFCCWSF